jgi:hypothetical protein
VRKSVKPERTKKNRCRQWLQEARERMKALWLRFRDRQKNLLQEEKPDSGRITMKSVVLNFTDVWGFGSRSIFNVIGHLLWRPGYMISDYLNGKHGRYLQPVNTLIITTLILMQAAWLTKTELPKWEAKQERVEQILAQEEEEMPQEINQKIVQAVASYDKYRMWCDENRAFGMIARSLLYIFFTWLLFRHSPRPGGGGYNIAEIMTATIYILCQMQVLTTIFILLTRNVQTETPGIILIPGFIGTAVIYIDNKQLFRRSWWGTLWRTLLTVIWI